MSRAHPRVALFRFSPEASGERREQIVSELRASPDVMGAGQLLQSRKDDERYYVYLRPEADADQFLRALRALPEITDAALEPTRSLIR